MMFQVFGALALVLAAFGAGLWIAYRQGHKAGYQANDDDRRDRREALRAEKRARAAMQGHHLHQLSHFPDRDWAETLASTGELRALSETGDMDTVRGHVAAFFRTLSLQEWTRKKETAA